MMRTISVASLFLLIAAPGWALSFGVGCANPCGREEIVIGSSAVCTAVLGNDSTFLFSVQPTSTVTVTDADGVDVLPVVSGSVDVPPGTSASFPVTIGTDALDVAGDSIAVEFLLHSAVPGFSQPVDAQAGSRLAVIASETCFVTTTTTTSLTTTTTGQPTTTTSTTTTTTTTVPVSTEPRMKVCAHNDNPKKCLLWLAIRSLGAR